MTDRPDWLHNVDHLPDAIERALAPGIATRIVVGDEAMFSIVRFEPHSVGEIHDHPEEQWGILVSGRGTRLQDGEEVEVSDGDFWLTPGGVPHGFRAGPHGAVVIDVFAPQREAYRSAGCGFAQG